MPPRAEPTTSADDPANPQPEPAKRRRWEPPMVPVTCPDCGRPRTVRADTADGEFKRCRSCAHGNRSHGMTGSRVHNIWMDMRRRCGDSAHHAFRHYGGRGIKVCDRWRSFEAFYADMGDPPTAKHTIDREDNDGDYRPENCRWITQAEQMRNRRNNRRITFEGETRILADWARIVGIPRTLLDARLNRLGWSVERALTTPVNPNLGRPRKPPDRP